MFRNTFQSGFLSVLYSIGSKPLQIWDKKVRNGHIKRITDQDIQSSVLEIMGTNVSTNYITCPADAKKTLGIKLPFLVMIIKNLKKYFTFEVQVLDDKNVRRRFRASNYQSTMKWNHIVIWRAVFWLFSRNVSFAKFQRTPLSLAPFKTCQFTIWLHFS